MRAAVTRTSPPIRSGSETNPRSLRVLRSGTYTDVLMYAPAVRRGIPIVSRVQCSLL